MTIKVLVFPCGSEIGLEIHAALRFQKDIELYGASTVSDHGEYVYARYRQISADVDSVDFAFQINALAKESGIDIILPAHDSVILRLAACADQVGCTLAVPDFEVAALCRNKSATYAHLAHFDFIPEQIDGLAAEYPIFAKPAVGQGSKGAELVCDAVRHQQLLDSPVEYVFSEYLPGAEYTVDCISDAEGNLLRASPRERIRVKSGISVRTRPVALDQEVQDIAAQLAATFRIKGAWFFQVKYSACGRLSLLELAPRIAGSMGLSRNLGINYPLLSIYAYLGKPFSVLVQQYPIEMDRALQSSFRTGLKYDRVYLDLDDTLIINGKVNTLLMALLYQWIARDISVFLLTRHASCPRKTLQQHCIAAELFTDIIHIVNGDPKSSAIQSAANAIFIDDSYRERADVSNEHGMPVFDVDAIEQLLDWRA